MELRRKTINECKGRPRLQKAVALALYLKHLLDRTSTLKDYSINKLHRLSGISPTTLRKYLPVLRDLGYIHFMGKHNQHLVVSKLSSHTAGRNVKVDAFCFDSFKDTYNSLRSFLALAIQARKDFIRHTIQTCKNPSSHEELMRARKILKRLVKMGVVAGMDARYREWGLSFKRIAEETGNCVRTAQRIIKYAVAKNWCKKERHVEMFKVKNINFRHDDLFTFSTRNFIFFVYPNTYKINPLVNIRW